MYAWSLRSLARWLQFFNIKYTDYVVDVEGRFPQQNKIELSALSRRSKVAISGSQRVYSTPWILAVGGLLEAFWTDSVTMSKAV